jgi:hypothetical protein
MNATTFRWRCVVYDFLKELRAFLGADQEVYKVTFLKLGTACRAASPCQHHGMLANPRADAGARALKPGMTRRKVPPIFHPGENCPLRSEHFQLV